ncbi:MAG: F0F1 ATP synthase subunit gamma [Proteobacteria bacterium]|nr:F0F1 ATP synthase subunit gamma [Pseudomonadota bacterium]
MPSLKDLRLRIKSVRQTQKITAAMKMVAAAKLRRSQERVEKARPYTEAMESIITSIISQTHDLTKNIVAGCLENTTRLLIIVTSDRGLCGGFNASIVRKARQVIQSLTKEGRDFRLLCLGRKGRDMLKREYGDKIVGTLTDLSKNKLEGVDLSKAQEVALKITTLFDEQVFGTASIIYSVFKSALTQEITHHSLIPFKPKKELPSSNFAWFECEPSQNQLLEDLYPQFLEGQIFEFILEVTASEQGARMAAMDNATRNAREMIQGLELKYNRNRQATITRELIEIISGAEAL